MVMPHHFHLLPLFLTVLLYTQQLKCKLFTPKFLITMTMMKSKMHPQYYVP